MKRLRAIVGALIGLCLLTGCSGWGHDAPPMSDVNSSVFKTVEEGIEEQMNNGAERSEVFYDDNGLDVAYREQTREDKESAVNLCFVGFVKDYYKADTSVTMAYRFAFEDAMFEPDSIIVRGVDGEILCSTEIADSLVVLRHDADIKSESFFQLRHFGDKSYDLGFVDNLNSVKFMDVLLVVSTDDFESRNIVPEDLVFELGYKQNSLTGIMDDILEGDMYSDIELDDYGNGKLSVTYNTLWDKIYKPCCVELGMEDNEGYGFFQELYYHTYLIQPAGFIDEESREERQFYVFEVDKELDSNFTVWLQGDFKSAHADHSMFIGDRRWALADYAETPYYFTGDTRDEELVIIEKFEFVEDEKMPEHKLSFGYETPEVVITMQENMGKELYHNIGLVLLADEYRVLIF